MVQDIWRISAVACMHPTQVIHVLSDHIKFPSTKLQCNNIIRCSLKKLSFNLSVNQLQLRQQVLYTILYTTAYTAAARDI